MDNPTILLIEFDELTASNIRKLLGFQNYQVKIAMRGLEGLWRARKIAPDLIILDLTWTGMCGIDVCRSICHDPLLSDVPVILVTDKSKYEHALAGMAAGANAFLLKPFTGDVLVFKIQKLLARRGFGNVNFYPHLN